MLEIKQPIGVIMAEGAGPDITEAAVRVLEEIGRLKNMKFNFVYYKGEAPALKYTSKSFEQLKIFYKQIHDKKGCIIRGGIYARQVYKLRHDFNLTFKPILINPIPELYENSPFKEEFAKKVDILLVRENAQGLLMAKEKLRKTKKGEMFEGKFYYDKNLCRKFVEMCYEAASKRKKNIMFLIKGDVWNRLSFGGMWLNLWAEVGKKYPGVTFDWEHDDTWFGYFVAHPEKYDTVAALGISGDLITDPIATMAYGTRAITPSANIAPDGFMTFQTIHGAGTAIPKGKANPIAMIRGVGLMFEYYLKKPELSKMLDDAIRAVLRKGYRPIDVYLKEDKNHKLVDCKQMTDLIIEELRNMCR
ncbi:MAG: isocitrate/isopropylmalate family dehydrogenase [Candidatus Pacearchaeota archaeon]|jgi:3-isopropylmalate dehydrogenase